MIKFLRHLFIPHHTNNFKPRVLHGHAYLIYAVFFLTLTLSFRVVHAINPDILGYATNITVERLLDLTNQRRQEAGLAPLTYNQTLAQAAAGKASDMFGEGYWAHNSPSGKTPWDFIVGAGYSYIYAGENLAKNFQDSDGVVGAWMNSPTHKENILRSQYTEVGFAVVNGTLNGEEMTLVVQMFGAPQGSASNAKAQPVAVAKEPESTPVPTISATQPAQITSVTPSSSESEPMFAGAVVKKPLIDVFSVTKRIALIFSIIIMATLIIDGIYIWRKKIVRISGRNLAHVLFLTAVTGMIWLVSVGSIL